MTQLIYDAVHKPTIYFIGIVTSRSSIIEVISRMGDVFTIG
jgi:hypothetical protein